MDQALLFWEKYFKSQTEVTWDELASSFSKFILEYGNLQLDNEQLLYIKSIIDPDYRNIIKETFWKVQSKKQQIFKYQFNPPVFKIPTQKINGVRLKIKAIANGYSQGDRDIMITREKWIKTSSPTENQEQLLESNPFISSMFIVQTPTQEFSLKQEEVFIMGSSTEQSDFAVQQDLSMNPQHLKFVWTPYNFFLAKDISKSFRCSFKIMPFQTYILDYQMIVQLGPETSFFVKFICPLQKFTQEHIGHSFFYIETAQENTVNYFPYLMKQLKSYNFESVAKYREALENNSFDSPNAQMFNNSKTLSPPKQGGIKKPRLSPGKVITDEKPSVIIEFISGPLKGEAYQLDNSNNEYLLGKSKFCNIRIPDPFIQNEQARIRYVEKTGWVIQSVENKSRPLQFQLKQPQNEKQTEQNLDQTIFGNFILMANITQFELGLPSKAHVLSEGMCITVGPYLFEVEYAQKL